MCKPAATTNAMDRLKSTDVEKGHFEVIKEAELEWSNVHYTLFAGKKKEKKVLQGVSGHLAPASLLAIMGPSGSGKTSLLNVLAGRVPCTQHAKLQGKVFVNGESAGQGRRCETR